MTTNKTANIVKKTIIAVLALATIFLIGIKTCHASETYSVKVDKGYLALRTTTAYDYSNEIGELYTGDRVTLYEKTNDTYWLVYSAKYDTCGYVNKNYLVKAEAPVYKTVYVTKGYLALRTAMVYDDSNIIEALYNGEQVRVINYGNGTYWYVTSVATGRNGYVNSNYLY